ncbi:SCO7613 C-terminal domain-containing membrane protein [Microcella sp.]|uniref:SCO7613 C-terminal domain-containing membrane protein n=1 Tax=Microcella sp. TaxID=1913979 RepID=UPI0025687B38|nr:hypothetical protein [Microcella sp.]MBX9473091.1 hypothetical protein [Microcella sp.]
MTATPPPPADPTGDRAWAGRVVFPRSSAELRSTTSCPACFVPLTATVCASCGLDLRHEASAELARASVAAADAVDARLDLIGRIRRETASAAVRPATAPAASQSASTAAAAVATSAPPLLAAPADPQTGAAAPSEPRRSGIQIALVVVGVSLLSVFAVFALVFAFVTYGTEVRMAIITGGTLLTMIAAGALKRRGLDATGEGIAVLGTIMLMLVTWALRVDSPIGLDLVPDELYWGAALLIVAGFCGLWSLTNRLSTPAIVAAGLLPVGAALLTGHLVDEVLPSIGGAALTAGALASVITAALSWRIVRPVFARTRDAARIVAQSLGAIGATIALVSLGGLDDGNRWAPVVGGLVLAAAALLHVATSASAVRRPRRALDTLLLVALGGGAVFAAMAGAVLSALRFDQDRVIVSAPVIAAVVLAVVAEQAWRRSAVDSAARTAFASATLVAAAHAALAGGLTAVVGASAFAEAATQSLRTLPIGVGDPVTSAEPATVAALGALAMSLGLIAVSWATLGVLVHRSRVVTLIGSILVVAIVPLLGPWWLVMALFALLAVGGAVALHRIAAVRSSDARRALLALCITLASGAAFGAFLTGWATPRGGVIGLIIALVAIGIARPATAQRSLRAAAIALAAALVLGSVPSLARDAALVGLPDLSTAAVLVLTGALLIALTQFGRLSAAERHAGGGVAVAVALVASIALGLAARPGSSSVEGLDEIVALSALVVALGLVAVRRPGIERSIARAALPLPVVALALSAVSPWQLEASVSATVAIGAIVVVGAFGLLQGREATGSRIDRVLGDVTGGVLGIVVLAAGWGASPTTAHAWAPVLALAVLELVTAISRDGLIGSRSRRRFIGWVALALGTAALWIALVDNGIDQPEAYSLPLAGAVLAIAAANALLARRSADGESVDRTAAPLTAAALIVALVPTALASVDGTWARYVAVAVVAIALAIVPLLRPATIDAHVPRLSSALVATGFAALGLLTIAHTLDLVAVGALATGAELVRAVVIVALPAAASVAAWMLATGRLRDAVTAAGTGVTALSAGLLGLTGIVDPVELVSLPLAACLLAIGAMKLSDEPTARSWPWLGPGVAVLLVPSLLAIDAVGEPLWRAVALGVVAAGVFVLALRLTLQAPFVIGGTVLLVHLLVQSWPLLELVGDTVEWWVWLGLAGIAVIALGARYERRLQNVRAVAVRISHLR